MGFESGPDEFYHDYAIVNTEHPERRIEGLHLVSVELPKFKPKTIAEKKMAVLWLRFLTEIGNNSEEAPAELLENELTCKALSIVEKSAMSEGQLYAYERFWRAVIDEQAILEGGYLKGREEGAKNMALDTARKMKADGLPMETIAKYTGLASDEIKAL